MAATDQKSVDPTIAHIHRTRGLTQRIADRLGISRAAVAQWNEVPLNRVLTVSRLTGMPPYVIRPDAYPAPAIKKERV